MLLSTLVHNVQLSNRAGYSLSHTNENIGICIIMIHHLTSIITGQSFPIVSQLLTIDGLPARSLRPNSTIQMDTIVQWLFPSLTFESGLNIKGWLFQADDATAMEVSKMVTDNQAPTFTVWKRLLLYREPADIIDLTRIDLNSTQASSIHKIKGTYPSLYYFELKAVNSH